MHPLQVMTWAPQNDVLGHPSVKAFLSHCGANSMYEVNAVAIPQTLQTCLLNCPSLECARMMQSFSCSINILCVAAV